MGHCQGSSGPLQLTGVVTWTPSTIIIIIIIIIILINHQLLTYKNKLGVRSLEVTTKDFGHH